MSSELVHDPGGTFGNAFPDAYIFRPAHDGVVAMTEPTSSPSRMERLLGLAIYVVVIAMAGGLLVGIAGLVSGKLEAAGAGFIAAALGSGLLANALLRP